VIYDGHLDETQSWAAARPVPADLASSGGAKTERRGKQKSLEWGGPPCRGQETNAGGVQTGGHGYW